VLLTDQGLECPHPPPDRIRKAGVQPPFCFVSDSAETSFGSNFGCFESKLVSKDTLDEIFNRSDYLVEIQRFAKIWSKITYGKYE
jgi:hypothetical protein